MARLARPGGGDNCSNCIFSLCISPASNVTMQVYPSA